jgi:predicted transcriptional regulator
MTKTAIEEFGERLDKKFATAGQLDIPPEVFSEDPIEYEDAKLFIGREEEQEQLVVAEKDCIDGYHKRILLHGIGGSGKTSFANMAFWAAMDRRESRKIVPIRFNSLAYSKGIDQFYNVIFSMMLNTIAEAHKKRQGDEDDTFVDKKADSLYAKFSLSEYMGGEKYEIKRMIEMIIEGLTLNKSNDTQIFRPSDFIKDLMNQKLPGYSLMLVMDDFHRLLTDKNRPLYNEFLELIRSVKSFSILVTYTSTIMALREANDEIVKDSASIQIASLTTEECKKLLRARLLYARDKEDEDIDKIPDYSEDLKPFSESAVEILANTTNCIPLDFIRILKKAKVSAESYGSSIINDEVVFKMLNMNMSLLNLNSSQKQVLEYIQNKKEVTIKEIAETISKTEVYAYIILNRLLELGFVEKKRAGRRMIYSFKPIDLTGQK